MVSIPMLWSSPQVIAARQGALQPHGLTAVLSAG
jgi:hypothetical protein